MNGSSIPSAKPKLPIRLSMLEQMIPLSYDLFAWLRSTGIEHQPGPPETKMPWGINVPKLPHARQNPPHETCNNNGSFVASHGQRTFRSRSPAPAMIPQALAHDLADGAHVLLQDQAQRQVDANLQAPANS